MAGLLLGIALLYACAGNEYIGAALRDGLERAVPPVDPERLEPFDAVCVLGGGSDTDTSGNPKLGSAGDRVFLAARLWHAGKARLLVTGGMSLDAVAGIRDEGQATRALWRAVGIPDQAILTVPEPCWNTRDEIKAYQRLHAQYGWKRVALLSSAAHLPRAMALASKAGLACTPLGADRLQRRHAFQIHCLVPDGKGFDLIQRACWEYLGRWVGC